MKKIIMVCFMIIFTAITTYILYEKNSNIKLSINDNVLTIKMDNHVYKEELLYNGYLSVELKKYEYFNINDTVLICILTNNIEIEEGGNNDNLLIVLYKDSQFINIFDGLKEYILQDENYLFNYLGDKKMNISLPESDFNVIIKNVMPFNDVNFNENLTTTMEHKSRIGHTNFSNGLRDIEINNVDNNINICFSKFIYGFFHADIIGEICYFYEYRNNDLFLNEIKLKLDDLYEFVIE